MDFVGYGCFYNIMVPVHNDGIVMSIWAAFIRESLMHCAKLGWVVTVFQRAG